MGEQFMFHRDPIGSLVMNYSCFKIKLNSVSKNNG